MTTLKSVHAQAAFALLGEDSVLVDVREPAEFNTKHIPKANLHPLSAINAKALTSYGDKTVVIYCQKGIRGQKACEKILQDNPQAKVVNLTGGIEAWQAAGLNTIKGDSNVLPLDRQVQITIGAGVLIFSLLGYFYQTNFIFGAAFMGAGLLFAGISGFCGLARIMALAPWNK
ncbi:MAG: rhodanese-related sulfurtransferase [Alphaproteobacteria bacterium]|jgi:rhodanese-related sulfurtransferase